MSIIQKFAYGLNVLAILGLILAYISPYVDPHTTWLFSFFALGYPILIIINVLFVIYWLISKPKVAALSILFLALGISPLLRTIGFNKAKNAEKGFKVMSYNIALTRGHFSGKKKKEKIKEFKDFVMIENPDVVCLQEKADWQLEIFNDIFSGYEVYPKSDIGTVLYSKFPISNSGNINFGTKSHNATWIDVSIKDKTYRIYGIHISSNLVPNLTDNLKEIWDETSHILDQYNSHAKKRVGQLKKILDHAETSPFPVVITGDFNDIPQSYIYRMINKKYKDPFIHHGNGMAKTFKTRMPGLRIDYAFVDENIEVLDFDILNTNLSDHYPIVTTISTE